jgi:DNA-binding transcriptional ArsR family regulator
VSEWAFITKHAVALSLIARHPRITALDLGGAMQLTERATRKIVADLYAAGYIEKKREGRRVRYRINPDQSLRHDAHQGIPVGNLLEALGWKRPLARARKKNHD